MTWGDYSKFSSTMSDQWWIFMAEATFEGHEPEASPETVAAAAAAVEDLSDVTTELAEVDEALDTDPLGDEDRQPA